MLQKIIILSAVLGFGTAIAADTSVSEVWTCHIKDGKTMDDVRAANSKWVKYINAHVDGGDIGSDIVTSVVGNAEAGRFLYVDTFPTLESWAAAKSALDGDEEGEAIDAELEAAADCEDNRLYNVESS
jgi:hypothetical protein